jgi:hypothetical protein
MLNRFFISLGILFGGLNFMWFGVKSNGGDSYQNPVWRFLDGFVDLEKYTVLLAAGIAAIVIVIGIVFAIIESQKPTQKTESDSMYEARINYNQEEDARRKRAEERYQAGLELIRKQAANVHSNHEQVVHTPIIATKPIKPTAQELKEKAIGDILRG